MDNEMKSRIKGLEQLGVLDYSDVLLRCIQSDCISRLICEKELKK